MKREGGATMVEYLIMVAGIAIALVAVIVIFQQVLSDNVQDSVDCVSSAIDAGAEECPGVENSGD